MMQAPQPTCRLQHLHRKLAVLLVLIGVFVPPRAPLAPPRLAASALASSRRRWPLPLLL